MSLPFRVVSFQGTTREGTLVLYGVGNALCRPVEVKIRKPCHAWVYLEL